MGVGYEIGRAIGMKKPVLCVFRPDTGKGKQMCATIPAVCVCKSGLTTTYKILSQFLANTRAFRLAIFIISYLLHFQHIFCKINTQLGKFANFPNFGVDIFQD